MNLGKSRKNVIARSMKWNYSNSCKKGTWQQQLLETWFTIAVQIPHLLPFVHHIQSLKKKIPKTESRGAWNWNLCTTCWPSCLSELLDLTSEMCFDVLLTKMKHPEEASHWKRAWRLVLLVFFSYKGCVCPVQQSAFLVLVLLLPYYIANTFISRTSGQGCITSRMHRIPCDSALCIVSVSVCAKDYLG